MGVRTHLIFPATAMDEHASLSLCNPASAGGRLPDLRSRNRSNLPSTDLVLRGTVLSCMLYERLASGGQATNGKPPIWIGSSLARTAQIDREDRQREQHVAIGHWWSGPGCDLHGRTALCLLHLPRRHIGK